jgi:hypothetical protein
LRRKSMRDMSDPLIGNNPRIIVDRERAQLAVYDGMQDARLRF